MSINSVNTLSSLNRAHQASSVSMRKLATGSKFPGAAFGPSDYAIIQRTYSGIGAAAQANNNTQNANSILATASGAAGNTIEMLSSLRSQILQAANGTNGSSDLATLQKSVNATIGAIDDNAYTATFNGKTLLDGSQGSVAVADTDGYTNVPLGNLTAKGLGLTDDQGNSTIDLTNPDSISSALDTVDSALNKALDQATTIGAAQQGLEYKSANQTAVEEGLLGQASVMDSMDIAKEVTKLSSSRTLEQMALFATKMQMQNRSSVLSLLS